MRLTVSEIAAAVQGRVLGDGTTIIEGAAGLSEATPRDITFVRDASKADTIELYKATKAAAVFIPKDFQFDARTAIVVDSPIAAFSQLLAVIGKETENRPQGIHPSAVIDPSATVGREVSVGPQCVIEKDAVIEDGACLMAQVYVGARSRVGQNALLYPQVVLREDVAVGKNCILHPGVVIGADGYGFFFAGGRHNKIPHVGGVVIQDDVEIGANSCVDRAMTGFTVIGRGTKIDNLVQVAHNVQIGPMSLLVSQVGIGGSTKLGAGVVLGGQVGVADHVTIGDGVRVGAQSGIGKDVEKGATLFGTPVKPMAEELKLQVLLRRLPELFKEVKKLREKIGKNG